VYARFSGFEAVRGATAKRVVGRDRAHHRDGAQDGAAARRHACKSALPRRFIALGFARAAAAGTAGVAPLSVALAWRTRRFRRC
jgi:hypothetical protein